ncbi:MAG: toxin HicA [bacterium]
MAKVEDIITQMEQDPRDIRFTDLCKVCKKYFGDARQNSSNHRIYQTPWQGDPRINIQNDKGKAKAYQVKQVLEAIKKLEKDHGNIKG